MGGRGGVAADLLKEEPKLNVVKIFFSIFKNIISFISLIISCGRPGIALKLEAGRNSLKKARVKNYINGKSKVFWSYIREQDTRNILIQPANLCSVSHYNCA